MYHEIISVLFQKKLVHARSERCVYRSLTELTELSRLVVCVTSESVT